MHGDKQLGIPGILLHLAPQAADQHVYGAIARAITAVAGEGQDPLPAQHPPGIGDKGHQHLIFRLGQAHRHPVTAKLATGNIEAPGAEAHRIVGHRRLTRLGCGQRDSPQQVLDPHQQFPELKRLGDIVVGPHLKADDPVHRIAATGHQDDPHCAASAQFTSQQQAILPRQVDVQHHQGHLLLCQHGTHLLTVLDRGHPIALPLEIAGQFLAGHGIVFNNQNVVAHGQGPQGSTEFNMGGLFYS